MSIEPRISIRCRTGALGAVLLCAVLAPGSTVAGHLRVRAGIVDLGSLPGDPGSFANDINDRGEAVGASLVFNESGAIARARGVRFHKGQVTALPMPPGADYSWAFGNNIHGVVVGEAGIPNTVQAARWRNDKVELLGTLPGGGYSFASDLNDRGVIAGGAVEVGGRFRAVTWDEKGMIAELGTPDDEDESYAIVINRRGQACGLAFTRDEEGNVPRWRAILWNRTRATLLPDLVPGGQSVTTFLNERGVVSGWSTDWVGQGHAVLWVDGQVIPIGELGKAYGSWTVALNDRGEFIVQKFFIAGPSRSTLWGRGRINLNELLPRRTGWSTLNPLVMNSRREIVGSGRRDGLLRAFALAVRYPGPNRGLD